MNGADGFISRYQGGQDNYFMFNAHGDTILTFAGWRTGEYHYDAWGAENNEYNYWSDANPIRYSGQYTDAESGMQYLRGRYYSSEIRRFITEDPAKDGLNWYAYCGNNPIGFIDSLGLAPTKEAAALMASHIYDWDEDDNIEDRRVAGWRLIDVWRGGTSMKMGIYIPDDGRDWSDPSEYALVFRGSTTSLDMETAEVWANNILAGIGPFSVDMWAAISKSKEFVDSYSSYEITMVGHSKGGGEAIAAATKNGKNAITFNAANFKFMSYGLSKKNASGVNNYYVHGEILHSLIGRSSYGTNHWVDTQYYIYETSILGIQIKIPDPIANHSMDAFKRAFGI